MQMQFNLIYRQYNYQTTGAAKSSLYDFFYTHYETIGQTGSDINLTITQEDSSNPTNQTTILTL